MKYAINYNASFYHYDLTSDIIIQFKVTDNGLPHFIQEHSDVRIWLDCSAIDDERAAEHLLNALSQRYHFGVIANLTYNSPHFIMAIRSMQVALLFSDIAVDWDKLHFLASLGVTAIYVGEALGFELDKVASFLHDRNIEVWVYPNIAQSSAYRSNPFIKFWIRPEDVELYAPYVDVMHLWKHQKQQQTYLKIYTKGRYSGDLNRFFIDFNCDEFLVFNTIIPQEMIKKRISCGKACLKGATCSACGAIERITKKAAEVASQIAEKTTLMLPKDEVEKS